MTESGRERCTTPFSHAQEHTNFPDRAGFPVSFVLQWWELLLKIPGRLRREQEAFRPLYGTLSHYGHQIYHIGVGGHGLKWLCMRTLLNLIPESVLLTSPLYSNLQKPSFGTFKTKDTALKTCWVRVLLIHLI